MILASLIAFAQIALALVSFWLVFALLRIAREATAARRLPARRDRVIKPGLSRRSEP